MLADMGDIVETNNKKNKNMKTEEILDDTGKLLYFRVKNGVKTNDIVEKAFDLLEDMNQKEGPCPGLVMIETKKRIGDFDLEVRGTIDNSCRGDEIHSAYTDMTFTVWIGNHPTNGSLDGAMNGRIQKRRAVYQIQNKRYGQTTK
jgi:hypothetical protein